MLGKIRSLNPVSAWKFAHMQIPAFQIFLHQKNVVAFVNLKPAVPGHVLVSPRRHVPRLADLTAEETCDLWVGIAQVQDFIQEKYQVIFHLNT
jgi:bis(5'-adenosyl)-triphosphatase